jgi:PAS domain S-box-containing protein
MPQPFHTTFLYSPLHSGEGNGSSAQKETDGRTNAEQAVTIEQLQQLNEDLRQSRRAALNLMEDAVLSREATQKSEERYRTLFESIDEGFGIIQLLYDSEGKATDYRFLEVNDSFGRHTGLKNVAGKSRTEVAAAEEPFWLEAYDKVAQTGEAVRFEDYHNVTGLWYEVYLSRIGPAENRQVAIVFNDVTVRKKAQAALQESEERKTFLLRLSDAIRPLTDAAWIVETATGLSLQHYQVHRCFYCEIEGDQIIVRRDATADSLPSLGGRYSVITLPIVRTVIDTHQPVIVPHVATGGLVHDDVRDFCLQQQAVSFIAIPVIKDGLPAGVLCIVQNTERHWTPFEVELAGEVAERTWIAVEKAKAEEALRENEERKEFLLKLTDAIRDLDDPIEIQYEAARLVAEKLAADRVHFAEINDDEQLVIRKDYVRGSAPSLAGTFKTKVIAAAVKLERDEPVVIPDTQVFPLLTEEEKAALAEAKIRSQLSVALTKKGKKVASFAVDQTEPRDWKPLEIATLQEAAERTLSAVEKAKAEKEVVRQRNLLAMSMEVSSTGWGNWDWVTGKASWSENGKHIMGFETEEEATTLAGWMGRIHPDDRAKVEEAAAKAAAEHTDFNIEYRIIRSDGEVHWLQGSGNILYDENDKAAGSTGFVFDITARKKVEASLKENEERFRTLANVVPQVVWTNNAEGKADYFNERWYEYTGLSYEASVGLGWEAVVHPDDAPASKEKWQKALQAGEIFDTEYRLRRHDGVYCWFIGRNVPLKDASGGVTSWFGTATDVEGLKKAQEDLSQSEERLRITMESSTDYAIIAMDTERRIERWSSGAAEIFGYTEAEVLGQSADLVFTEEDRAAGAPQAEMETARDTGRAADERWHERKDGSRFFASGVLRPIRNEELSGYVKVLRDTTQQQLFTQELHRLVEERTRELQRSNEDLRQFAHVASHDLKEPVRKIQTFNNRILDEYAEALPPKVKTYAEKISTSANRMIQMIEGVLRYSKLGHAEGVWEAVDLGEIIGQITTDLELLIQQKEAVIEAAQLPTLKANPTLLYQLFYNLILNSLKFSKADEPSRITISSETTRQDERDLVRISLSDNGIGFEAEFAQDIFKTFTRLHPVEDYEGTGLGLALCKKIVEWHGGQISASGQPNKGATFTILLPLQ